MIFSLNFGKYDLGNDLLQLTDPILGWYRDRHKYTHTETKFYEIIVTLTTSGTAFYFTVNADKTPQKLFVSIMAYGH